jgi:hypothetical protein
MLPASPVWPASILVLVVLAAWYLSATATRLDRLHHRVEVSRATLEAQLVRRAAAALEVAPLLDPASAIILAAAAGEALDEGRTGDSSLAEPAQSALTEALAHSLGDAATVARLRALPPASDALDALGEACRRVQLARRFHNDAVTATQRVRRKRMVRWARLAGRAGRPQTVEIDDALPAGLA